ncbi:MarR family transcriptional regulator [Bernardetia sp. Wsw4-3y2]|uniref:MarR family winged helix-turn-helix transcriptional regulator n=1 Tax=Bernardetia sp. Wsw4-3y2 TaxID=3127471 RepID=UPI0030CF3AFE
MEFNTPTQTALYSIEQAIKEYRKFCQRNISTVVDDITIDQCLVLIILDKQNSLSQKEIAIQIFKDSASITRMIELMVNKDYLTREIDKEDRRRFNLKLTEKGKTTLQLLNPVIEQNRKTALYGLSDLEINQLYSTLQKIISNCQ